MKSEYTNTSAVLLKNLHVGYGTSMNTKSIFGPVDLEISHAEMVGIIGRNGIGKSTLLRTIAGIQPQLHGEIVLCGIPSHRFALKEMAKVISYVSTEPIRGFRIKVNELIAMGRFPYTGFLGKLNQVDRLAINRAIEQTGISDLLHKSLHELSDGERQKVMITRALVQDTPVIILDEPTAFLDLPARYEILKLLNSLTANNKTVLFSTHDLSIVMDMADRIWLMAGNEIFQGAPEDLLINNVFRKLFLNSPAEFDMKTSSFRFIKDLNRLIEIQGEKKYRTVTKRAMERIGIKTVESGSDMVIKLYEQEGRPMWQLKRNKSDTSFDSIYSLVSYLKNCW